MLNQHTGVIFSRGPSDPMVFLSFGSSRVPLDTTPDSVAGSCWPSGGLPLDELHLLKLDSPWICASFIIPDSGGNACLHPPVAVL